jgi:hypothetical protein
MDDRELDRLGDEIAELSLHLEAATARLLGYVLVIANALGPSRCRRGSAVSSSSSGSSFTLQRHLCSRREPQNPKHRIRDDKAKTWPLAERHSRTVAGGVIV